MNALILAAGYATRLYPLTLHKAKPLLDVAGKPMIEWVLDNLAPIPDLESVHVVTNHRFVSDFKEWAESYRHRHAGFLPKILDDGSTDDSNKLGAIGDINLALSREEDLGRGDLIIVGGDNLFTDPLVAFAQAAKNSEATLGTYDVGNLEAIKKYSSITIDSTGTITQFEEKPANPKSTLTGIALYYFSRPILPLFATYLAAGNNPDQPGRFIQWLYPRKPVKTHQISGIWYDIGSKETLEEANRIFAKFTSK